MSAPGPRTAEGLDDAGPWPSLDLVAVRMALATWFERHARELPWRTTRNPWHVWLSEVMLQQTRVDQGLPYFLAFIQEWPSVADFAAAELEDVLRKWEGLGYYARARNLHAAARKVVRERDGVLPSTYADWLELPGVGPYTAAAIASLAHGEPRAVVDGNVVRVLTRLAGIPDDVTRATTRKHLDSLASCLLDPAHPGRHNEAMMELGATVCTPRNPRCDDCPVSFACVGLSEGDPTRYPVKRKKERVPHHDIVVALIRDAEGRYFVQRRPEDAMLGGLWEFPGGKRKPGEDLEDALRREVREELDTDIEVGQPEPPIQHAYSHFRITLHAWHCRLTDASRPPRTDLPFAWTTPSEMADLPFPRANRHLTDRLVGK